MPAAEKLSIAISPDMMRFLQESVEAGEFATTGEAMRDALRVWREVRRGDAARLATIRERIRGSIENPRASLSAQETRARMTAFMDARDHAAGDEKA